MDCLDPCLFNWFYSLSLEHFTVRDVAFEWRVRIDFRV